MTVIMPETVSAFGTTSVVLVKTIADMDAPKLATEIKAVTSVNVSCFLYDRAVGTATTNKGTRPRKLCTRNQFQSRGVTTYEVGDLSYSHNPQKDSTDSSNKAKTALVDGSEWYMVVRSGVEGETELVVDDYVDIWPVELLNQNRGATGDDEFAELAITQGVIVTGEPVYDVQIVT